jgi:hypothetical protein
VAWESFGVDRYALHQVALNTPGLPGIAAFIRLEWTGQERATLWFYRDDGAAIPSNASFMQGSFRHHYARFRQVDFGAAVDLLRNERPVFFQWNEATKGAVLSTSGEPVGESDAPTP